MVLEIERRFLMKPIVTIDDDIVFNDMLVKLGFNTCKLFQYYDNDTIYRCTQPVPNLKNTYSFTSITSNKERLMCNSIVRAEEEHMCETDIEEFEIQYMKFPHIFKLRSNIMVTPSVQKTGVKEILLDEFDISYQKDTILRIMEIEFTDTESANKFSIDELPKGYRILKTFIDKEITDVMFLNNIHLAQFIIINKYLNQGVSNV